MLALAAKPTKKNKAELDEFCENYALAFRGYRVDVATKLFSFETKM